jgi:hypothetical protein
MDKESIVTAANQVPEVIFALDCAWAAACSGVGGRAGLLPGDGACIGAVGVLTGDSVEGLEAGGIGGLGGGTGGGTFGETGLGMMGGIGAFGDGVEPVEADPLGFSGGGPGIGKRKSGASLQILVAPSSPGLP